MRKRLKNLCDELTITEVDLKIDAEAVKRRVNASLNADFRERKQYMKYKLFKTAAIAASISVITAMSVFAVSPAGQNAIGNIISFFQNEKAVELTSLAELSRYNEAIGKSVTKDGYTLTLDNIAADDNFLHVFYTAKSDTVPFYTGESERATVFGENLGPQLETVVFVNGEPAGLGSNHNTESRYFADRYTLKVVEKYNIAGLAADALRIELFGELSGAGDIGKLYSDAAGYAALSAADKAKLWYLEAEIDKAKVKVDSKTCELNLSIPGRESVVVEKVVFSPFGSQLIVSEQMGKDEDAVSRVDCSFAVYDENETCLDILNTDLVSGGDGAARNSLELLKASKDTKQLKFVPIQMTQTGDSEVIEQKIGAYPLSYQVNPYGKVVVTDIRIRDEVIEIDYYKDGYILFDPGFQLLNDRGENAEPGGKLGCTLYTDVHHDTNSYTARYVYEKYDEAGRAVPADDTVKAEGLKAAFTTLGVYEQMYVKLDFDHAVTADLK